MANPALTLAALAVMAVPDLDVHNTRLIEDALDGVNAAVLSTSRGELMVRHATTSWADSHLGAEAAVLRAFTEGTRNLLPFAVPTLLGVAANDSGRALVTDFLPGDLVDERELGADSLVLASLVAALRAVHSLPISVAADAGVSIRSARDVRNDVERLVERADATRLVPASLIARWQLWLDDVRLWQLEPAIVHGELGWQSVRVSGNSVTAMLDWASFTVGDPAIDLAWLLGFGDDVFESAFGHYRIEREVSDPDAFITRARFAHELEIARWLLHGVESHDQSVVNDAVQMFDRLLDKLAREPQTQQHVALSVDQVEHLLDESAVITERSLQDSTD